jgi:FAD/FMN-containing dehydrogenase
MAKVTSFVEIIKSEFPDDRLTWQKAIPTFHPESAEEAAKLVGLANQYRQPLYITGFGNNIDPIGESFEEMVTIRTDRLNELLVVEAEDFYVTAGAGYPLKEMNLHLHEAGLYMPHADLPYVGSLGGAVSVNLTGEVNGFELPLKKYLIQAKIVTPEGEIIKPGSVCFKSVSGYDIVKIYAPSWGLLGLLVELSFRVLPLSAAGEYVGIVMQEIDRDSFIHALDESNDDVDAFYSRKIKHKFDPRDILPIV